MYDNARRLKPLKSGICWLDVKNDGIGISVCVMITDRIAILQKGKWFGAVFTSMGKIGF